MSIKNIKKGLGLLIVDIVIIIGIFILQFRTDSRILEKSGLLQITLQRQEEKQNTQNQNDVKNQENEPVVLKNSLRAVYNGLSINIDDQNPAKIYKLAKNAKSDSAEQNTSYPLQLQTYSKTDDLSYEFDFSENVKLFMSLSSAEPDASLTLRAEVPQNCIFYLPYSYDYNAKLVKEDGNKVVLDYKKTSWEVQAYSLNQNCITFKDGYAVAMYNVYEDIRKFTFDSITDLAIADSATFDSNIAECKKALITAFDAITVDFQTSEQAVVSYIAAKAEKGEYVEAIDAVSSAYRRSPQRTYLSAPYLNSLDEKNTLLETAIAETSSLINRTAASFTPEIFTVRNISYFLCIEKNAQNVSSILKNAAVYDYSTASLAQVSGVMKAYINLLSLNPDFAAVLRPAMESCIEKITDSCALNGDVLTISENDTFLSVLQAVDVGESILHYGIAIGNETLKKAGYAIVNSYLEEASSFDLRTLASLYPVIATENWYYPHFEKIRINDSETVWAWTCARSIKMENTAVDEITYTIDFPESYVHYVIIKGVPRFRNIYIYNMAFRTDSRFETYNSSGYVYKRDSQTLLLKSRHKSQLEKVRIELNDNSESTANSQ